MAETSTDLGPAAKNLSDLYRNAGKTTSATAEDHINSAKRFVSGMSRPLLQQMGLSGTTTKTPVVVLDLACGSGVVTQELQRELPVEVLEKSRFVAGDSSEALVGIVGKRIEAEDWRNVEARVTDAMDTKLPDGTFSHVCVAMGLHLIPRPDDALREIKRIIKPGGILGATTPHFDPEHSSMQFEFRSAFASFPFEAPFPDPFPTQMHSHGRWADPSWVETYLRDEQGLKDVEAGLVKGAFHVEEADDFLASFWPMAEWIMGSWWSEETRREHPPREVRELTRKFLVEKHGREGWDVEWAVVCATGRVEK